MIFRLLLSLWARRRGYTRAHEAQLRGMSDGELADLGIGRSQIPSVMCEEDAACHAGLDPASMTPTASARRNGLRVKPAMTSSRAMAGCLHRLEQVRV
jgi:uncharacterized protein YjiS (DUF1127 family)